MPTNRNELLLCVVLAVYAVGALAHHLAVPLTAEPRAVVEAAEVYELAAGIVYEPSPATGAAVWVAELLTPDTLAGRAERVASWRVDHNVPPPVRARDSDYTASGYDRGHLAAAANYGDQQKRNATFRLANAVPQIPSVNQGPIKQLEDALRRKVADGFVLLVVTAPLYELDAPAELAARRCGRLPVPTAIVKAVLVLDQDLVPRTALAYRVPNVRGAAIELITVDAVEAALQRDLFSFLPDELEARLEAGYGTWPISQRD